MARKLNADEQDLFDVALSVSESGREGLDTEWFWEALAARRDTALALTPEVQALLESKFPERMPQ